MDKRALLFAFGFMFFCYACKKDSNKADDLQFKLNGSTYTFDSIYAKVDTTVDHIAITAIYALNTKTRSSLHIGLQSTSMAIGGLYTRVQAPSNPLLLGFYFTILSGADVYSYSLESQPFTIQVSQSDNQLQGSFSGNVSEQLPQQQAAITNGQFNTSFSYR